MRPVPQNVVSILGTRGIPARHGGFESFAEQLALFLSAKGWHVSVYCPTTIGHAVREDAWNGVRLVHVPVRQAGPLGTVLFDWKSTLHAAREGHPVLTLGYNTAAFLAVYWLRGTPNLINMDGIEWQRPKWSLPVRGWFFVNERLGCLLADHIIADHPEIYARLTALAPSDKITMIPYGAKRIETGDATLLAPYELTPAKYALLIARPEPENSILEIARAFSRKRRGIKLAVIGAYDPQRNAYHRSVMQSVSDEVTFLGPVYEKPAIEALRFHARLHMHGHRVGGTNPTLVEALGAGNPILCQDNRFNRWVAGAGARYFNDETECSALLDHLLSAEDELRAMGRASVQRFREAFTLENVLRQYEALLEKYRAGGCK